MDAGAAVLAEIEVFLREQNMSASAFGRGAVNDAKLVPRLRRGENVTVATIERAKRFIDQRRSGSVGSSGAEAA